MRTKAIETESQPDPFILALDEAHKNRLDELPDSGKWARAVRIKERQYKREQRNAAAAKKPRRGLLSSFLPHSP